MHLEVLKEEERFRLHFYREHDRKNGTTNAFSSCKLTREPHLLYLEVKLQ